jgi:hypothetical protein
MQILVRSFELIPYFRLAAYYGETACGEMNG